MNSQKLSNLKGARCLESSKNHTSHPKYRPDIDGLRALAVLAVVGFHAFPTQIRGGFVGVDIFFVISGFLISTIILGNIEVNKFSFLDFYSRRIKRIFPALLAVLTFCYVVGWYSLLTDEFQHLGKHIAAGAAFVSYLFLWDESGYFDKAAESKPLLHLWSLGIEEQFYIFWPVLLWLGRKMRFNLFAVIVSISIISFGINILKYRHDPTADFYSPQSRFWELLIGAILACYNLNRANFIPSWTKNLFSIGVTKKQVQNAYSFFGFTVIAVSILLIPKDKPYPGLLALLPTIGAALVISSGPEAWINRKLLSKRILVGIGLISYPLYLWHWPLLYFSRILFTESMSVTIKVGVLIVSFVLSWLTYLFIEGPIRKDGYGVAKTVALFVSMAMLGYLGYETFIKLGYPDRYRLSVNDPLVRSKYMDRNGEPINCQDLIKKIPDAYCYRASPSPYVAILGDSHAGRLFSGFRNSPNDRFKASIAFYATSCELNNSFFEAPDRCKQFLNYFLDYIKRTPSIEYVVISLYSGALPNMETKSGNEDKFLESFGKVIKWLDNLNKKVVFVIDNPSFGQNAQLCIQSPLKLREHFKSRPSFCQNPDEVIVDTAARNSKFVQRLRHSFPNVFFYDSFDVLCRSGKCSIFDGEKILYDDPNHLSVYAGEISVNVLIEQLSTQER